MSNELKLIKQLAASANTDDFRALIQHGLTPDVFSPGTAPMVEYMLRYYQKYRTCAPLDALQDENESWGQVLDGVELSLQSPLEIYTRVLNDSAKLSFAEVFEQLREMYQQQEGVDVVRTAHTLFTQLSDVYAKAQANPTALSELTDTLLEDYLKLVNNDYRGYAIPWQSVRESIKYFEPGQITSVVAKSGVGKTWWLLGCIASILTGDPHVFGISPGETPVPEPIKRAAAGKVLLVSYEMPVLDIARRLAAILSGVSFARIRSGKLTDDQYEAYKNYLDSFKNISENELNIGNNVRILGPESVSSPQEIDAQAQDFGADVVVLDGFYLMDGPGDERWQKVQHNMQQIRNYSLRSNHHYLLASQLNRDARTKDPSLDTLSFSQSIVHDSNNIIFLSQTTQQKMDKQIIMSMGKVRDGDITAPFINNWDFTDMNLSGVGYEVDMTDVQKEGSISLANFG